MNIKQGKLNYDQSGRAYPDNHEIIENWDCIWQSGGKCYRIVGLPDHAEWSEVNIYDEIIDAVYEEYKTKTDMYIPIWSRENFVNKTKTEPDFYNKYGLNFKIEERELSERERIEMIQPLGMDALVPEVRKKWMEKNNVPTKLITITYNNETVEVYQ